MKFIDQLEKAGYSEHQAKETAKAYQAAHEGMELATKQDLRELELKLDKKLSDLILWVGGIVFTAVTTGVGFLAWFIENHGKV
jgi:hypothetical protein